MAALRNTELFRRNEVPENIFGFRALALRMHPLLLPAKGSPSRGLI